MSLNTDSKAGYQINYLTNQKTPEISKQQFYQNQTCLKTDFGYLFGPQSHLRRRKVILQKHPEISKLLIPTKLYSIYLALILVPLNVFIAYLVKDLSWPVFLLAAYVFGGTISHTCHVLVHDFTHWSGHQNILVNKIFAIFCNIATGIPSALAFGIYHSDHHNYMGEENRDPDLPTRWEASHFQSKFSRFLFFLFLTPIYGLRPFIFMHKKMTIGEIANFLVIICTNILVYKLIGGGALGYLLLSAFFSIGAHPAAIHALAEHFEFVKGMQTYDYFGIWNIMNLNVGYHLEHHDFPTCPWYNLPAVRAAAPEWYEYLPYHTSYTKMLFKFIFDDKFNLFHRTIRVPDKKSQ